MTNDDIREQNKLMNNDEVFTRAMTANLCFKTFSVVGSGKLENS